MPESKLQLPQIIVNLPLRSKPQWEVPLQKISATLLRCLVVEKLNESHGIANQGSRVSNLLVDSVKIYTSPSFSILRAVFGGVLLLASITLFAYLSVYKVPIFSADNEISLVIIDHSLSMAVEDMSDAGLQISRLEYSKNHILLSFQKSQSLGIISYAKNPSLLTPLSTTAH